MFSDPCKESVDIWYVFWSDWTFFSRDNTYLYSSDFHVMKFELVKRLSDFRVPFKSKCLLHMNNLSYLYMAKPFEILCV